jgi:hypothetical protein
MRGLWWDGLIPSYWSLARASSTQIPSRPLNQSDDLALGALSRVFSHDIPLDSCLALLLCEDPVNGCHVASLPGSACPYKHSFVFVRISGPTPRHLGQALTARICASRGEVERSQDLGHARRGRGTLILLELGLVDERRRRHSSFHSSTYSPESNIMTPSSALFPAMPFCFLSEGFGA